MGASSSSSTEPLAPGATVAGFRVERVLGHGRYEATQLALERRVAFEIRPRLGTLPERVYLAGECEHGYFVATPLERRPRRLWLWAATAAAVAAAVWTTFPRGDDVPAPARGATLLGSALPADGVRSVDCARRPPNGASRACTVVQAALPHATLVAPVAGTVRAWTVRGAAGDLALTVIRGRYT